MTLHVSFMFLQVLLRAGSTEYFLTITKTAGTQCNGMEDECLDTKHDIFKTQLSCLEMNIITDKLQEQMNDS